MTQENQTAERANVLTTYVINDAETYQERVDAMRMRNEASRAQYLSYFTIRAARLSDMKTGEKFTSEEILTAALGVFEYMRGHVADLDRVAREHEILRGRTVMFRDGEYVIVPSDLPEQAATDFRVVSLATGSESSLYSFNECGAIIKLAKTGELKGSFDQ